MNDPDLNQRILQSASDAVVPLGTDPTRHPWFTMGRATILLIIMFGLAGLTVIGAVFLTARTVSGTPEQTERIVDRAVEQVQQELDRRTAARDVETATRDAEQAALAAQIVRDQEATQVKLCALLRVLPDPSGEVEQFAAQIKCPAVTKTD